MFDRKGNFLEIGQEVKLTNPNQSNSHMNNLMGNVVDILEKRGSVIVEDHCSEYFEVDTDELIVLD